jgi:hypothetical protein
MKYNFFILLLISAPAAAFSQESLSVTATSAEVKVKEPVNLKRYKKTPLEAICGYYSKADQYFYDCDGAKIEKVTDESKLKDGADCCRDIRLSKGEFETSGKLDIKSENEFQVTNEKETFTVTVSEEEAARIKREILKKKLKNGSKVNLSVSF